LSPGWRLCRSTDTGSTSQHQLKPGGQNETGTSPAVVILIVATAWQAPEQKLRSSKVQIGQLVAVKNFGCPFEINPNR